MGLLPGSILQTACGAELTSNTGEFSHLYLIGGICLSLHPEELYLLLSWADLETMLPQKAANQTSFFLWGRSFLSHPLLQVETQPPKKEVTFMKTRDWTCLVLGCTSTFGWKQIARGEEERFSPSVVSVCQFDETGCETVLYAYKTDKYRK